MVRLADLSPAQQQALPRLDCPEFDDRPWVRGGPLAARRVAIVSTAGLMLRGERPVTAADARFRAIPDDAPAGDILMSHASVNFDRTGFQRDMNVAFPRDRLHELRDAGVIGSVAATHWSHMGAIDPVQLETPTRALAATLKDDGVDSAVLLPV